MVSFFSSGITTKVSCQRIQLLSFQCFECVRTRAHVDERVVDKHKFVEVELVGEPLPFGLVEDPLVVVVSKDNKMDRVLPFLNTDHISDMQ